MRLWRQVIHGVLALLRREQTDRDLAEEVRHYLEAAEEDLVGRGATRAQARREIGLRYGDGSSAREDARAYGWESAVEALGSDLRLSIRRLGRSPGFTVVATLTLGLGIGASTAIFSVVRPVLFEPLPYPEADRILAVADRSADGSPAQVAFGSYLELSARARSLEAASVFKPWQPTMRAGAEPERLEGQSVSAGYFDVLGVAPRTGPGFDASSDRPGGTPEVILSDGLWRRRFGADPGVVGRAVHLDTETYTIVGVMPAGFESATAPKAELWSLLRYDPGPTSFESREWGHHLDMIARLGSGVELEEARRDLESIADRAVQEFTRPAWASMGDGFLARPLKEAATAGSRPTMLVLLGAVALLALGTCANLIILLLARGSRRRGEFAMRAALGAGRGRLARYLLTESLLLACLGGALGIVVARFGVAGLVAVSPPSLPRLDAIALDGASLAFALGLTTLVGVLVGVAPSLTSRGARLPQAMREAGRGSVRRSRSARRTLVVAEVALAVVLLVGAGLVLRSTHRLFSLPPGFDASHVVVMQVIATGLEGNDAATHAFFDRVIEAVADVPGVGSAVATSQLPLSGDIDVFGVTLDEPERREGVDGPAYRYSVSPGYFEAMGIRLVRGRILGRQDVGGTPPVAVVSESLARRLYPGVDPLGNRIWVGPKDRSPFTIVGVVGDVKQASLGMDREDGVYVTSHQWHWADRVRWIAVRAEGDAATLVPALRRAVWSVDSGAPIVRTQSMEALVARSEAQRRFVLIVLAAFATSALTLASVGLYGVVSGSVTERMSELGVRAALGASREDIRALVVRQGMALTSVGVGIGLAGAVVGSEALATLLFGVSRLDPATYGAVVLLLGAVAVVACSIPAVRASRVDPLSALKAD